MAATIPDAELSMMRDCGHFTNLEDASTFNATVEDFLRRRRQPPENREQ
jgi:pimeloyl-ACP methyl ester carboxylesterase